MFSHRSLSSLFVALFALPSFAAEIYVSSKGNDASAGSKDAPVATIARAQQRVREQRRGGQAEAFTVWIDDGLYPISATLECKGAEDADVTYRARHDGAAVLDASTHLDASRFSRSTDARLAPEARGKVWQCDLGALGVQHVKAFPERFNDGGGIVQVFFHDAWQPLSRWPNEHNARMLRVLDRGDEPGAPGKRPGTFAYRGDRPKQWQAAADAGQLWVAGFWRVAWDWQNVRVKSLDAATGTIALAAPVGGGIGSKYAGPQGAGTEPWRAINLVEEIDMPGEWAIDFTTKTLFFWPPQELEKAGVTLADFDGPIVRLKDTSRVTFRGLVLKGTLGNGVEITGGSDCHVAACTLTCLGKNGVVVKGGKSHRVESCDLFTLGHGGILLGGGDRPTLTPCGHVADNNHIHHYALAKKIWSPGIGVGANDAGYACGCIVTHNLVHDSPHAGILYGGNDHRFELNEVHDFLVESDDLGGFYTNNGWTSYGNVLRHNFIHHAGHALGIYLDDGDSGDVLEGNVMYRMGIGAAIGGGHDNVLRGNLAIECPGGFAIDSRGVSRKYDQDKNFLARMTEVKLGEPPWSERYPSLATILDRNPALPVGCIIENNIVIGTDKKAYLRGKPNEFAVVVIRGNAALAASDLGFADAGKMDFRMAPSAPAFQQVPEFKPIPFGEIGLYRNSLRLKLPEHQSGHTVSEWHRE